MVTQRLIASMCAAWLIVSGAGYAYGQSYPSRPIRVIIDEAGGGSDFVARLIAQGITGALGQPVIVENRGGGGTISGELVAHASPDGHTLLVVAGTLWIGALLRKTSFDPIRELAPITLATATPNLLIVHPSVPANSVRELIALAKARPGTLNYSSGSSGGGSAYLAAELFKAMAGVDIVHVTYKGSASSVNAVLGNEVQMMFPNAALAVPHLKSGRLRALAVTTPEPSALFPDLPTVAAAGLPGYESVLYTGMFVPARTPPAIIGRLNQETVRFLNTTETKDRFLKAAGAEVIGSSPEKFAATIKSEMARVSKLIKDAGIRIE